LGAGGSKLEAGNAAATAKSVHGMSWLPLLTDVSVGIIREITIPGMAWWETIFDWPFDQFFGRSRTLDVSVQRG
jgi:hypothetical protein